MDIDKLTEDVEKYCKENLSEKRWAHSIRVADMCVEIAELCGYDKKKAYLAGIAHDICKEIPKPEMMKMVEEGGYTVSDYERKNLSLLHGKAGALFLKNHFNMDDKEIYSAIENHVSGTLEVPPLGMILYIADKNERGRDHISDEYIRELFTKPVREMFAFAVESSAKYLTKKGYVIYEDTYKMMKELGVKI
ncbi:MAG: bis(5'-nucleosyl)-tetraphosphatase (symmetrical) YqeK [Treponema sp.]|nr:bis(5'-nucleosyl)-tetraphosphatase (symmetrical) YqeK [Treponema sp.]